jgi:hypothetical protein
MDHFKISTVVVILIIVLFPYLAYQENVSITAQVNSPNSNNNNNNSGGGGGGGGGPSSSVQATVIFKGTGYPGSKISLLKDSQKVAEVPASPDANFEISLSGVTAGSYVFGVIAEDNNGVKSILHTFNITVTASVTTVVSGIFVPPTITLDLTQVKKGDVLTFFGHSAPEAEVKVFIHSETELIKTVSSNTQGSWLYKLDTSELELGDHEAKARASKSGDITTYSQTLSFKVANESIKNIPTQKEIIGDINDDGKVNLVDFSIAAYWYKRSFIDEAKKADINNDGKVDLVDFSIIAYYWTS